VDTGSRKENASNKGLVAVRSSETGLSASD
jgi:hypothetical protein